MGVGNVSYSCGGEGVVFEWLVVGVLVIVVVGGKVKVG